MESKSSNHESRIKFGTHSQLPDQAKYFFLEDVVMRMTPGKLFQFLKMTNGIFMVNLSKEELILWRSHMELM